MPRVIIAVTILFACAAVAPAQSKPNFSGIWNLNRLESDFGPLPAPAMRTDVIDHKDPALKVSTEQEGAQGAQSDVAYLGTDGRDSMNRIGSLDVKSKVFWQGNDLVVKSIVYLENSEMQSDSVWTLSNDGRTLTQRNHLQIGPRDLQQVLVFDKARTVQPDATSPQKPSASSPASAMVNYSGVWKLVVSKSEFGALPGPDLRTDVIDHHEPAIKIETVQDGVADGKQEYTTALTTDGRAALTRFAGLEGKSTASWVGQNLVVSTRLVFQGSEVAIRTTYVLSEDGKALTQYSRIKGPTGDIDQKLVFERQ